MGNAAVKAAKAVNYENAGTVEFLVDADGSFYFIEMNTRIQVEHPVTEEITGVDLLEQQLRIAAGEKLPFSQEDITYSKHAIECRICAENPNKNFMPSPGTIELFYAPGGPGVRIDSHAYSGYTIPPNYDSMIGKLICVGATREAAIRKTKRALSECIIRGIATNIDFLQAIVSHGTFQSGDATTKFIEENYNQLTSN
jgi:acetyl-CoA carboxylase biotin carboxylase subunit